MFKGTGPDNVWLVKDKKADFVTELLATRNNVLGSSAAQHTSWKRTIKHSFESERQTDRQAERILNITHRSKQRN